MRTLGLGLNERDRDPTAQPRHLRRLVPCDPKRTEIPEDGFRLRYTLHLPSIKVGSETSYRFIGVLHALNQRRARLYR